jgi:hypothetical protein
MMKGEQYKDNHINEGVTEDHAKKYNGNDERSISIDGANSDYHAQPQKSDDAGTDEDEDDDVDVDDDDDDDDDDILDEDLDAFLVNIEARLRADFTSFDLSSVISSQGSSTSSSSVNNYGIRANNNQSSAPTPSRFLRLMQKVFPRAAKPIKLRALMSVMGLDNDDDASANNNTNDNLTKGGKEDGRKTDVIVWRLLSRAINEDKEMWVQVIAGIIRSIMFQRSRRRKFANKNDGNCTNEDTESKRQLRKITNGILKGVEEACQRADSRFEDARENFYHVEGRKQQETEAKLSTLLIGADIDPSYVPLRYSLLSPSVLRSILPELDFHHDVTSVNDSSKQAPPSPSMHFAPNMDAEILNVDDSYVEEEDTTLAAVGRGGGGLHSISQTQPHASLMNGSGISRANGARTTSLSTQQLPVRERGGRFSSTGRGGAAPSSLLFRPSSMASGRGGLAGTSIAVGGRMGGERIGGRSLGRDGGRLGSLSRLQVAGGGRGRGAVAATATSLSMAAPLHRRVHARAILTEGGRGGIGGTKMKMIDDSEAEDLNRAQAEREKNDATGVGTSSLSSVQARALERKRKLLEDAAASGLRNRNKKRTTGPDDGDMPGEGAATVASVPQSEGNNGAM